MLKKLCSFMLVVILVSMFPVWALANAVGYVTASALNIRQGPGTSYGVAGLVYNGAALTVLNTEGDWYKVSYNGGEAFVFSQYIRLERVEAAITSRGEERTPEVVPTAGENIVAYAKNFIGVPYQYGGNGPNSFDCSGFVKYVYAYFGVNLPRTSYSQMNIGVPVSRENLIPGDLVFFRGGGHVGIYVGNNTYIHSPQTGRTVSIDDMNRELYTARRIF